MIFVKLLFLMQVVVKTKGTTKKSGQQHAPAALYFRERPGTHCTGGLVGPRTGLDGRKISPHRDSILGPSIP
jgi:hypothetical protein